MEQRPVNNNTSAVFLFFVVVAVFSSVYWFEATSRFFIIHRDILGEAGESVVEAHEAPVHSRDETLVISISPDVFRGRREEERGEKIQQKNPRDSVGCVKKKQKPRAQNKPGDGVTASLLEFLLLMSISPWRQQADILLHGVSMFLCVFLQQHITLPVV